MLLHNEKIDYEIFASDINTDVIKKANVGLYPLKMMGNIPENLKFKYCLKGKENYEGWFLVDRILINNIKFENRNLLEEQKDLGLFDVIFLRNVLIYFSHEMKKKIINNVMKNLKVGGYIIISLTEHIRELDSYKLKKIDVSIFQKVD
jgi:chemotaxis protein methyltransferase CheR